MNILDQIKHKFDGVSYSNYVMIVCPYHGGDRENFIVHKDWGRCLTCNKRVLTKVLAKEVHSTIPKARRSNKTGFRNPFTKYLKEMSLGQLLKMAWVNNCERPSYYMVSRGISIETQKRIGIGQLDSHQWITFPIRDRQGIIVGSTARAGETNNSPAKYVNPSNQISSLLYVPDWSLYKQADRLYITFGIIDCVSLMLLGHFSASTTTGKQVDPKAFDWWRKEIVIIPDRHEESAAYKLRYKLGLRGKVLLLDFPTGKKDCNNLYVYDKEALNEQLVREYRDSIRTSRTEKMPCPSP